MVRPAASTNTFVFPSVIAYIDGVMRTTTVEFEPNTSDAAEKGDAAADAADAV